jgi:hypothetical protein
MNTLLPISGREMFLKTMIISRIAIDLIYAALLAYLNYFDSGFTFDYDTLLAFDVVYRAAYFVHLIVLIIATCMWMYRASQNLHKVQLPQLEFSAGWSVGWWFIPIANWWKPFQVMRELYRGSLVIYGKASRANYRVQPFAQVVGWWWALWLVGNIFSNMAARLDFYEFFMMAHLVETALDIGGLLALFVIVRSITQMQTQPSVLFLDEQGIAGSPGSGYEDQISRPTNPGPEYPTDQNGPDLSKGPDVQPLSPNPTPNVSPPSPPASAESL